MEKVPNILKDGGISRQGDIWDYTDILIFVHETLPLSDIWKKQRVIKGCWIVQTATFSYICWMNYFDECRLLYCSWFPAHFAHLSDRQQPINHQMHLFLILVLVSNWISNATFFRSIWFRLSYVNNYFLVIN